MTTLVTPSTLTAAISSLTAAEKATLRQAMMPGAISSYTQKTLSNGVSVLLTSVQFPSTGIVTVSGMSMASNVGNLNGDILVGGLLTTLNYGPAASATQSATNVQVGGSTHYMYGLTGSTGFILGGPVTVARLPVTAGQYLNFIATVIWQGSATNTFLSGGTDGTNAELSQYQPTLSYTYVG